MGFDFRLPNINGTEREMLLQIRSYLYQFIPQLQFALESMDNSVVSNDLAPWNMTVSEKSNSSSAGLSFAELKALIIKSEDILQAYYEEINARLSGVYAAKLDFVNFKENAEKKFGQNDTEIKNLKDTLAEINAHIKSGILYSDEDGNPVYGLEIGQKNTVDGEEVFNKFARFTAERCSFYDQNGTEVAYVIDDRLCIQNLEIYGGGISLFDSKGDKIPLDTTLPLPRGQLASGYDPNNLECGVYEVSNDKPLALGDTDVMGDGVLIQMTANVLGTVKLQLALPVDEHEDPMYRLYFGSQWRNWRGFKL